MVQKSNNRIAKDVLDSSRKIIAHPFLYPLRQLNVSIKTLVRTEPSLWLFYQPYVLWAMLIHLSAGNNHQEALVSRKTDLLIDGYEGSANSFAAYFFKASQRQPIALVHHTHAPVQIIKAVQLDLPVLLTIREPKGATLSLTSRWPFISVTQALHRYIKFYSKIEPYISACILSPFEQTTQHLDLSIQAVNQKFGTQFDLVNMQQINTVYGQMGRTLTKEMEYQSAKHLKAQELNSPQNQTLLAEAEVLYAKFEACV